MKKHILLKKLTTHKKNKFLNIIINTRTKKALDHVAIKNMDYQNMLKQQDIAFADLKKAGLNKEQKLIVDNAISATNECGAVYGIIAYKLGFYDGIRLAEEIKDLSV